MVRSLNLNIIMLSLIVFGIYVQHDGSSMKVFDLMLSPDTFYAEIISLEYYADYELSTFDTVLKALLHKLIIHKTEPVYPVPVLFRY